MTEHVLPLSSRATASSTGTTTDVQQAVQGHPEESAAPRLYVSTGTRLYELLYSRREIGYREGRLRDDPLYALDFLSTLRELPFSGDSWYHVVGDIGEEGGHASYFHVPPHYDTTGTLGNFLRITHSLELPDIQSLVLIRPSHITHAIAELHEDDGELWHVTALNQQWFQEAPPQPTPSSEIQKDEHGIILYDVFARGHYSRLTLGIRMSYEDALNLGNSIMVEEQGLLLSYDEPTDYNGPHNLCKGRGVDKIY